MRCVKTGAEEGIQEIGFIYVRMNHRTVPFRDTVGIDCLLLFTNLMAFQNFFGCLGFKVLKYLLLA
jgi:hypothetical protein